MNRKRKRDKEMRIWLVRWNGEKEDQLYDLHNYKEEEKKEEREPAFGDEDSDLGLQMVLLESNQSQLWSSSTSTDRHSSKKIPRDEKMKGVCTDSVNPLRTFGSWTFSVREGGEPSCGYCVICNDAKPIRSIKQSNCGHYFCEDCFQIYVGEKLQENILSVKCPEKDCKKLMEAKFWRDYVPDEVFDRRKMACLEGRILVSPVMILCPFCFCEFVDDGRRFLIRACTKCWKIFCMNCRVRWHMGMSCREFQLREEATFLSMVDVNDLVSSMITNSRIYFLRR